METYNVCRCGVSVFPRAEVGSAKRLMLEKIPEIYVADSAFCTKSSQPTYLLHECKAPTVSQEVVPLNKRGERYTLVLPVSVSKIDAFNNVFLVAEDDKSRSTRRLLINLDTTKAAFYPPLDD